MEVVTPNPAPAAAVFSALERPRVARAVFPLTGKSSVQPGGILFYLLSICWGLGGWLVRPPWSARANILISEMDSREAGREGLLANGFFFFLKP